MFLTLIYVALGGAIGAVLRFLTQALFIRQLGDGFPWGTVCVNVVGSFVMGILFVVFTGKEATVMAPFLMVGVLGGFTTFSAFSLDALRLFEGGQFGSAALYVVLSMVLSLCAVALGIWCAKGGFA